MSTARGAGLTKKRAQKHKNTFAFKNDLHDKTPQMKKINQLNVCEVCERCKAQIEWRIKYKKYKLLTQAKTCIRCSQRTIKKAYHVICKDCAKKEKCCAKCLKTGDEIAIEPAEPSTVEQQKLKVEMDRLIKSLPERKRRTFLRFAKKGKENNDETNESDKSNDVGGGGSTEEESSAPKLVLRKKRLPHTRADLLNKIEMLRITEDDGDDDDDAGDTDEENDDSEYDYEFSDDLASEDEVD